MLNGFGTVVSSLGIRTKPYLPQICGTILFRLNNKTAKVRQQAADLISRIAPVMMVCGEEKLLGNDIWRGAKSDQRHSLTAWYVMFWTNKNPVSFCFNLLQLFMILFILNPIIIPSPSDCGTPSIKVLKHPNPHDIYTPSTTNSRLSGHLGVVLYEYLGEEYPEVLGSILGGLKAVVNVIGMHKMTPPIKDLLPRLTPILKNRHEKVQENCIDLVGRIADRWAVYLFVCFYLYISDSELPNYLRGRPQPLFCPYFGLAPQTLPFTISSILFIHFAPSFNVFQNRPSI